MPKKRKQKAKRLTNEVVFLFAEIAQEMQETLDHIRFQGSERIVTEEDRQ